MPSKPPIAPGSNELAREISQTLQLTSRFLAQIDPVAHFEHVRVENKAPHVTSNHKHPSSGPVPFCQSSNAKRKNLVQQPPAIKEDLLDKADQPLPSSNNASSGPVETSPTTSVPVLKSNGRRQRGANPPPEFADLIKWMRHNFPDVPLREYLSRTSARDPAQNAVWIVMERHLTTVTAESRGQAFQQKVIKGLEQEGIGTQVIDWQQLADTESASVQLILIDSRQEKRLSTYLKAHQLPAEVLLVDWESHADSSELKRALWRKIKQCVVESS